MKKITRETTGAFIIISVAYIASYTLVAGFIAPLQGLILPTFTTSISLLFLPHGIRVLAAYYYGWKALPLLLPSMYLMWFITVYANNISLHPLSPLFSGIACIIAVKFVFKNIKHIIEKEWKLLLLAGLVGSFLNGLSHSFLVHKSFLTTSLIGYTIGDILGQILLMIMFIYILKFIKLFKN